LKLLKTIYPIESHESRIKDNRLFELLKQAVKFQCIVKGNPEIENISLLQDPFTEEQEKKVLERLWGGHKLNIKEERSVQRDIDLSESASSLYFGAQRTHEAQKRPVTAHSSVFAESFLPKRVTKLDVKKRQAPERIVKDKTYEEEIAKDHVEIVQCTLYKKEEAFQYTEPEKKQVVEEPKPVTKAEEYYEEVKDNEAQHIDISKLTQRSMITDKQPIRTCCFSPEGELLAIGTNSMTLIICSVKDIVYSLDDKYKSQLEGPLELPIVLEQRKYHNGSIYSIDWSHTGRLIASGSNDRTINLLISPFSDPSNADKVNPY